MNQEDQLLLPFHLFDRDTDVRIVQRRLPHWSQAGAACFITWRTQDSMPQAVLDEWYGDRGCWLQAHGIEPTDLHWRKDLERLNPEVVREFLDAFWNRWHDALDTGHGACVLMRPEFAKLVAESLQCLDGKRYLMFDFVVMPNHVHLLASFPDQEAMLAQCESWKRFTATRIHRCLNQKGRFWQQDGFDHLVRSEGQFSRLRRYIAGNPAKAKLRRGEFLHYSRLLE